MHTHVTILNHLETIPPCSLDHGKIVFHNTRTGCQTGDSYLQEQQVIFRKGEWALRRQVGDVTVIKFIWVCPVLTCVESIFPG